MQGFQRYLLYIYRLFSLYRCFICFDARPPVATNSFDLWRNLCASLLHFVVRVRCRR